MLYFEEYAVFRDAMSYLDNVLAMSPEAPSWRITEVLSGRVDQDFIQKPAVAQTLCTALQIGLVDLLASWSIRPAGIVGHSSGEMAAAYAAGRITAVEAIVTAYYRGHIVSLNNLDGAMLAIGFGPEQADDYIRHASLEG